MKFGIIIGCTIHLESPWFVQIVTIGAIFIPKLIFNIISSLRSLT